MQSGPSTIFHHNRYCADAACEHCGGLVRHESWCITLNPNVLYAYQVVAEPGQMTLHDRLILHSLGVLWDGPACAGKCKTRM